jgi:hypothetical protein
MQPSVPGFGGVSVISWVARRNFLREFPQHSPDWGKDVDWATQEARAKQWDKVGIKDKADEVGLLAAYCEIFRFGSSYVHSDVGSLGSYWQPRTQDEPTKITALPSDELVDIALAYAFQAMAVLAEIVVSAFKLDVGDRLSVLRATFASLASRRPPHRRGETRMRPWLSSPSSTSARGWMRLTRVVRTVPSRMDRPRWQVIAGSVGRYCATS